MNLAGSSNAGGGNHASVSRLTFLWPSMAQPQFGYLSEGVRVFRTPRYQEFSFQRLVLALTEDAIPKAKEHLAFLTSYLNFWYETLCDKRLWRVGAALHLDRLFLISAPRQRDQ